MQVPAVRAADAHAPSATTDGLFARVAVGLGVLSGAARVLDEPTGSGLPAER